MNNWCDFRTSAEIEENQERRGVPTMSHLSGTLTSGKSTLFNVFTKADVYAANQLFATLDDYEKGFLEGQNYLFF